jgi:hypothetical protein
MGSDFLKELSSEFVNEDLEVQTNSIECAFDAINYLVNKMVDALRDSPNRYFIAERIGNLGSIVIDPIQNIFDEAQDPEAKVLSSLVLIQFGVLVGIPYLLRMISQGSEHTPLIVATLAKYKITQAVDSIESFLYVCDVSKIDVTISLIKALEKLGRPLSDDLLQRFMQKDIPWEIKMVARKRTQPD